MPLAPIEANIKEAAQATTAMSMGSSSKRPTGCSDCANSKLYTTEI